MSVIDPKRTLEHLEELADRLGIQIKYEHLNEEDISIKGGSCILKGKNLIIIDNGETEKGRIRILVRELSKHNLDNVYIPPRLRSLICGEDQ